MIFREISFVILIDLNLWVEVSHVERARRSDAVSPSNWLGEVFYKDVGNYKLKQEG